MGKELKTNAMRILEQKKIPYRANFYECEEFIDGLHVAKQLNQEPERSFKSLIAKGKSGAYYVFALPVAEELDLKKGAKSVGEKAIELIPVKDLFGLTGYVRGGCTAIGLKKPFFAVYDETAILFEEIIISGGRIGAQILLNPMDLPKVIACKFDDITI